MTAFRVTKYNPAFRSETGSFTKSEWTSIGDIGRKYSTDIFTLSDYLEVEEAYVGSVRRFLAAARITKLQIKDREIRNNCDRLPVSLQNETREKLWAVTIKNEIEGQDIDWMVRLNLRECVWCRMEGKDGAYVHFGWDYYMYCGLDMADFQMPPLPSGMYAEVFESPH